MHTAKGIALALLVAAQGLVPQTVPAASTGAGLDPPPHAHETVRSADHIRLVVSTPERRITAFRGHALVATYPVAIGRDNALLSTPLRVGGPWRPYTIRPGDTLWSISRRFGTDVWALHTLNPKLSARMLHPGDRALVPERDLALTPHGVFYVSNKILNPVQGMDRSIIPRFVEDPRNEFGTRWIGLSGSPYGIHGTNDPSGVGGFTSRGCIRMQNADIAHLFRLVEVGTKVLIE